MAQPFTCRADVDAYLDNDLIECLICGRRFQTLNQHLPRIHQISGEQYREEWRLPRGTPLAGRLYRNSRRALLRQSVVEGRLTYDHLPRANEASRSAEKWPRPKWLLDEQRDVARAIPHDVIQAGGKRADGRDAERARNYQREYRKRRK